jgi:acetyl-CoA carboxylase carboxyl transferase subunit alpha
MRPMPPSFRLPFERPIYELEDKLSALEAQPNPTPSSKDAIRNMRQEIARMTRDRT